MKRLMLLRHAKSSWEKPGQADIDRPLNHRGERAARLMGTYLQQQGREPELILCSTARRTRETVAGLLEQFATAPEIRFDEKLYLAAPHEILELISDVPDSVRRLMVVGHNPGMHELALQLVAEDKTGALGALREKFPTAALAHFKLEIDHWPDIGPGRLVDLQAPKNLV
ncbi:MAG: SixA phosphatase family protein [Alphaproteobacteria bacterium]